MRPANAKGRAALGGRIAILGSMKTKVRSENTKQTNIEKCNNKKETNNMNTKLITRLSSLALTACLAIGVSGAGAQTYSVTDLGVLPNKKDNVSAPAALNDSGQVTGTSGGSAFRYTKVMEEISRSGSLSRGLGINASGLVVGDSTFGKGELFRHAATFNNGSATDLGTLGKNFPFSRANGVNAYGQVVGSSSEAFDSEDGRAFLVSQDAPMMDLGTLGGEYAHARSINDSGFVTGYSQISEKSEASHAFVWQAKTGMLDLGTLAGEYSYGTFINAKNHVVGYSTIDKNNDRVHAFLHDGKEMLDLGSLGGASTDMDYSYALGINADDQVVGYSYLPSDGPWAVAFVYSKDLKGLMVNLNDLIGNATKEYRLDCATAINDKGQIVAIAYVYSAEAFHAVLLTPMRNGALTPEVDRAGAKLEITKATYSVSYSALTVQATYSVGVPSTTPAVLSVYESATNSVVGTLKTKNSSTYFGTFTVKGNPQKIWVADTNGKRADAEVVETK
jgi:probable HAF family extracellular repeat protein